MKKICILLLALLLLTSCTPKYFIEVNDDNTLTLDGTVYYPLQNSERFTDYGYTKLGSVLGGEVYLTKGEDTVLLLKRKDSFTYYVEEEDRGFDKPLEDCLEFFYVPLEAFDKNGRVKSSYVDGVERLKGEDAEDFAFYVFYGRPPQELGYEKCSYAGEVFGTFTELDSVVSAYSVYKYADDAYSIIIDGEEYLMEVDTARMIGIIK